MMRFPYVSMAALAFFSMTFNAGNAHAASGSLTTTVKGVQVSQYGGTAFLIKFATSATIPAMTGCAAGGEVIVPVDASHPGSAQMLQLALAALLSGRTVVATFYTSGSNACQFTNPPSSSAYPELRYLNML